MGSIAEYYEGGQQKGLKAQFMNLLMLMRVDGKIEENEKNLLEKFSKKLSLTDDQIKELMQSPDEYPMMPPNSREERYERFVQLAQMIYADDSIHDSEEKMIKKYAIALGFTSDKIDAIYDDVMAQLVENKNLEEILDHLMAL